VQKTIKSSATGELTGRKADATRGRSRNRRRRSGGPANHQYHNGKTTATERPAHGDKTAISALPVDPVGPSLTRRFHAKDRRMSLSKRYLKSRPVSKVTFRVPAEVGRAARRVSLVGEFNDWNPAATPMKKLKSGEFSVTLDLPTGREYHFRYLIDGKTWENDWAADGYDASGFVDAENSVVIV
jgi:hypothetical protein